MTESPPSFTREELEWLSVRDTRYALLIFAADVALYSVSVATAAVAESWWVRVPATLAAGVMTSLLFVVGHDACHQSLTPWRWLNGLIGRLAFLPSLHPYSLWDLGHNRTHHRYTNQRGRDYVWEPLTPDEYRALSRWGRAKYRFFRTAIGHGCYYLAEIWWPRMFFPRRAQVGSYRRVYWLDLGIVCGWLLSQGAIVVAVRRASGSPNPESVLDVVMTVFIAIAVPFLVFSWMMSVVVYLHHTHPAVAWQQPERALAWQEMHTSATVHVLFPGPINWVFHSIMEHTAHHLRPTIPMYRLRAAQSLLESRNGDRIVILRWTVLEHLRILAACKCFDHGCGVWVGYDGKPSTLSKDQCQLNST